jgi:hypothetical protein
MGAWYVAANPLCLIKIPAATISHGSTKPESTGQRVSLDFFTKPPTKSNPMQQEELLNAFIEWARNCDEGKSFIFDEPHEAVSRFLEYQAFTYLFGDDEA